MDTGIENQFVRSPATATPGRNCAAVAMVVGVTGWRPGEGAVSLITARIRVITEKL